MHHEGIQRRLDFEVSLRWHDTFDGKQNGSTFLLYGKKYTVYQKYNL